MRGGGPMVAAPAHHLSGAAVRAGSRPAAVIPAISTLVLVLLTADGPILVRAALRTRHGGAIEAFDFSGAMAQRAGIGWYGHVCSFSSVDAGRLRAALRLELYQIISGMVMWSSGDARARHHPRHRPADGSGAIPCPAKAAGRYRRVSASWLPWLTAWASVVEALRLRGSTARFVSGVGAGRGGGVAPGATHEIIQPEERAYNHRSRRPACAERGC
jgi:hypothetical protein